MLNPQTWKALEQTSASGGLVAVRLHPQSPFDIFAAREASSGRRLLLLRSARSDIRPGGMLPVGRGFRVQFVVGGGDPEVAASLQFELLDSSYADVFDVVGNDVLSHVLESADDRSAFEVFASRIAEWQRFLDAMPSDGLGEQARRGLLAELWFMREFLLQERTAGDAVCSWAGPKAQAKDFQLEGLAIEVKSSAAKEHSRFGISNELQLDAGTVGRLLLCGVLLEPLTRGGLSLPELVSSLRASLVVERGALREFSTRLLQAGYRDADAAAYTDRYAIRSTRLFEVRDDFPRIVAGDVRPGVGDIRYSILHSECERFAVSDDVARSLIRNARA